MPEFKRLHGYRWKLLSQDEKNKYRKVIEDARIEEGSKGVRKTGTSALADINATINSMKQDVRFCSSSGAFEF